VPDFYALINYKRTTSTNCENKVAENGEWSKYVKEPKKGAKWSADHESVVNS